MAHTWTPEQSAIFERVGATQDNLIIEALAGAAKTSTLVELAKKLTGTTLCLAFNKKIADEMVERMPRGIDCKTLNSLGHRVWTQALNGKRLTLSTSKLHHLTIEEIEAAPSDERDHLYETLGDIGRYLQGSKNHGHVPDVLVPELGTKLSRLMSDEEFYAMLPEEPTPAQIDVMQKVLVRSFHMALDGRIDYADQLLMPTVLRCSFPIYSNVLVDEAQDLSELNHVMLAKAAKRRIIAVGDSLQAIYAFRGAHQEGMPILRERFNMDTMHLSMTFRCPELICNHVRHHARRIEHWPDNPNNPGTVNRLGVWSMHDIPDGSAVLCRNNAPLFRFALRLLKAGRRPNLWGKDMATQLVKILEGLGPLNMNRADALIALQTYQREKGAKLKRDSAKEALQERVDCLRVFIDNAEKLSGAVALARDVFNSTGKVDLATGHKAKGAEWPNVFILDAHLLDDEGQDLNLAYVLATRSQRNLTYIETKGYEGE